MARTLVNAHQLAAFSGSSATVAKFAQGIYTGGLSLESGSVASVGTLSFYDGGNISFEGSKIQLYNNTNIEGTLTCKDSITVDAVTLTDTELGYLDGLTLGTAAASKVMTLDASADSTGTRNLTISGEIDAATGDFSGDIDVDGTANLDAVDIDGTVQIDGATTWGVNDTGVDVKMFGATAGSFLLWNQATDALRLTDSSPIEIGDGQDMTMYHDGTNSFITNKTGTLKVGTETSGIAIAIGHSTSEVTVNDNLTVAGNLTVTGTTTTVDVEVVNTANGVIFEGATDDAYETILKAVDPTGADKTVQIANASGFLIPFAAVSTTAITSTPEELNLLDGVAGLVQADLTKLAAIDSTAAEVNLLDGGTSVGGSITLADGDGFFCNDSGASKLIPASDLKAYIGGGSGSAEHYSSTEIRTSGDLNVSGSTYMGGPPMTTSAADAGKTTFINTPLTGAYGIAVYGEEGANGVINISADQGDDAADTWQLAALAGSAAFQLASNSATQLSILANGDTTILGDLTITGDDLKMATNTSGYIMVADGTSYNPVAVSGDVGIASNGAITIAAGAVENSMLADDAVGADELAANAVVNASIASNAAIDIDKLDGGSCASALTDLAQGDLLYAGDIDASNAIKSITFSNLEDAIFGNVTGGDATIAAGGALTIGSQRVVNAMLADDAVDSDELAAGAVDLAHMSVNSIDSDQYVDGSIDTAHIANDQITNALMADDAIDSAQLAAGSVDDAHLSDGVATGLAGGGLLAVGGEMSVDFVIDTVIGSSGHNYTTATGVYVCTATALTGSEMVYLNGQMLMPGDPLTGSADGDYSIGTGSIELNAGLKLDGDDVLRVYYLK